jgi:uncharacterized protein (TIGR00251 family)
LELKVHAQPGARRTEVAGLYGDAVKIRIAAPPVDGKANQCLLAFLAGEFAVGRSQIELVSGETSRAKQVLIRSPQAEPPWFSVLTTQCRMG